MTSKPLTIALVGNPNTGKSTLFNALSGMHQHVGNYPGVTVEMKRGHFRSGGLHVDVIDLPGTYSLAARSLDEMVVVDLLLGRRPGEPQPDGIVSVVDASNLDRHLYLTTQVMELGVPVVLAVNMLDVAAAHGLKIDCDALSAATGLPVVAIQANHGIGLEDLKQAVITAAKTGRIPVGPAMPEVVDRELKGLMVGLNGELPPALGRRLLFDVGGHVERWLAAVHGGELTARLAAARNRMAIAGCPVAAVEAKTRFAWVRDVLGKAVTKPPKRLVTRTDRIDQVLTHRLWGTLILLTVMFALFQSIFVLADPFMGLIDDATGWLSGAVAVAMDEGPLRSLLADGIVIGVGSVIKFLPQILILFAFIAVLEDCGYMSRAAFLMDRVMSRCGLSGKSFIPLLSSVACAVPGVMATRVIENRRDRFATIAVAPLMSCSARLPVYLLLIEAFLSADAGFAWWVRGVVLFGMYLIGFVVAPAVAWTLKMTVLRGGTPVFVMELPAYKRPTLANVAWRMFDAGSAFLRRAGTLILASMVLIWASLYFPAHDSESQSYPQRIAAAEPAAADQLTAEWKEQSYLGRAGKALEPVFQPLGWDWKIGMAVLASFPAREVIVGTLGIIYQQGEIEAGDSDNRKRLGEAVRDDWRTDPNRGRYAVPVALSIMVFFALCMQCASTLAVIFRETRSWSWPVFTFVYMTTLAYVGALVTYQVGRLVVNALEA